MNDAPNASGDPTLENYKRPSLTVDAIVLCVYRGELSVVLHHDQQRGWGLPGTFVHEGETLLQAVNRGMSTKLELSPVGTFRQLHVFDDPHRDNRGWVFSVAHYTLVSERVLDEVRPKQVFPVDLALTMDLAFDHSDMIRLAVTRIREECSEKPDPWNVLGQFTLRELRDFHFAIDPSTYLRDTFRRVMEPQLALVTDPTSPRPTDKPQMGRPSRVWRVQTSEEKLMRYAEKDRLNVPRSRLSTDERPNAFRLETPRSDRVVDHPMFSVEFSFEETGTVKHENLREREAYRLFDDFVREASGASDGTLERNRPTKALIRSPQGSVLTTHKFSR